MTAEERRRRALATRETDRAQADALRVIAARKPAEGRATITTASTKFVGNHR